MSRSIHATRAEYRRQARFKYAQKKRRRERLGKLADQLQKKRWIKRATQTLRRHSSIRELPPAAAETIPIKTLDENAHIHYPASPEDLREILRRLPPGSASGLHSIQRCLGREEVIGSLEKKGELKFYEPDPWTARPSVRTLSTIYKSPLYGIYDPSTARLFLYAYVYASTIPNRRRHEFFLKLEMLETLVHEISHHIDNTTRRRPGRVPMGTAASAETYAKQKQTRWLGRIVVPYLRKRYPEDCRAMEKLFKTEAGLDVSIVTLFDNALHSEEDPKENPYQVLCHLLETEKDLMKRRIRLSNVLLARGYRPKAVSPRMRP